MFKLGLKALVFLLILEVILRGAYLTIGPVRRLLWNKGSMPGVRDFSRISNVGDLVSSLPWSLGPYGNCNGYILNSNGLRTPEYELMKKPGTRRIILLGDSFLCDFVGLREEVHFTSHLTQRLAKSRKVEIINMGVDGAGPKFYLRMLEIEGSRISPDDVVVCLYVGNDLTDEPESCWGKPTLEQRFASHFFSWRVVHNLFRVGMLAPGETIFNVPRGGLIRPKNGGYYRPELYRDWPPLLTYGGFVAMAVGRSLMYEREWSTPLKCQWESVKRSLERMQNLAIECGARFHVLIIPDECQVDGALSGEVARRRPGVSLDFGKPQAVIIPFLKSRGIDAVDLLPGFKTEMGKGVALYRPRNTHWNAAGQNLAAAILAGRLGK